MFHMLGRFALTLSFSRRSSPGFSIGSARFGFGFCERASLSVFIISISIIRNSKLLPRLLARPIPAPIRVPSPGDVPQHSYGSVLAQSHALGARGLLPPSASVTPQYQHLGRSTSHRLEHIFALDRGVPRP